LLLGPRYVLLRREFLRWRDWQRTIPAVARRVLVSFDAAAYPAAALRIVEVLGQAAIEDLEVVLIGLPDRAQSVQLEDAARGYSIRLQVRPNAARMPALLTQADAVVGAADLSCYEQLFMGMPSLLIPLEADQQARAAELAAHGAAVNLGPPERLDVADAVRELLRSPARREAMLGACRRLIDGYGAVRACMHLRGEKLWLRKTTMDDAEQLWKWANDPDVRANSFSHEPIQWHSHLRWLANKLADPNAFPFVAFDETDAPIGRLRFDTRGQQAKVSLAIGKEHRGAGYGSALLKLALSQLFRHTTVRQVHAFIRPANVVSIRLFERAGFQRLGIETIAGSDGLHYVKRA
jgi:RimJ/RimL family protein N-acetyltransferase